MCRRITYHWPRLGCRDIHYLIVFYGCEHREFAEHPNVIRDLSQREEHREEHLEWRCRKKSGKLIEEYTTPEWSCLRCAMEDSQRDTVEEDRDRWSQQFKEKDAKQLLWSTQNSNHDDSPIIIYGWQFIKEKLCIEENGVSGLGPLPDKK
jgi:hypothetical protein